MSMGSVTPLRRKPPKGKPAYVWRDTDGQWWVTFDKGVLEERRKYPIENGSALEVAYEALLKSMDADDGEEDE